MPKVDFDTVNLDGAELDKMNLNQLVLMYAIFYVMEADLWDFANKHDAFDDKNYRDRRAEVEECLGLIRFTYIHSFPENCLNWGFRGCLNDKAPDDLSHYDIESEIRKKFGTDGIQMDSESSWFYVNTTELRKNEVEAFLKENWGDCLDFSVDTHDFDGIPEISNWSHARGIVKKAGIDVSIAMPELSPKPEAEIKELVEKASATLMQTGLSRVEAVERLMSAMNVASDGRLDVI